jgi:hypothetical protein
MRFYSLLTLILAAPAAQSAVIRSVENRTITSDKLQTWWHPVGEINTETPVEPGNVRQSRLYDIQVAIDNKDTQLDFYDSFVYEAIPRSGNGRKLSPVNGTLGGNVDGVSIEGEVGINMAWTQFLHACDAIVKIRRNDGRFNAPGQVIVRPTTTSYTTYAKGRDLFVKIPYQENGHKVSIEFQDDLWTYHGGGNDTLFVQDLHPKGHNYVESYNSSHPVLGIEPINGLLLFASPIPDDEFILDGAQEDTYTVHPGYVSDLTNITESNLYFGPGVYWFGGDNHAILSSSVSWLHLAPGAYVKGAIEYRNNVSAIVKATGHGVISGEQYVYQANVADGYTNNKSDETSLRMWSGNLNENQTWICQGPTIVAPPFNTMDFHGEPECHVSDYKQVGAFFWQTDGMAIYPKSKFHDIFYHIGDDGIKAYYSNVQVDRINIWKTTNDPIIQMGWSPRNVTNFTANDLFVIHARFPGANMVVPSALIGASPSYADIDANNSASLGSRISNFNINNIRCEGICPSLLRWNMLQNYDNYTIDGVYIEQFPPETTGIGMSIINQFTDADGNRVQLGEESPESVGLTIKNYYVGNTQVSLANDNWQSDSVGKMNIPGSLWGRWTIE